MEDYNEVEAKIGRLMGFGYTEDDAKRKVSEKEKSNIGAVDQADASEVAEGLSEDDNEFLKIMSKCPIPELDEESKEYIMEANLKRIQEILKKCPEPAKIMRQLQSYPYQKDVQEADELSNKKTPKKIYLKMGDFDGMQVIKATTDTGEYEGIGKDTASAIGALVMENDMGFEIIKSKGMKAK